MGRDRNELESKWVKIGIENINQNKLFTLVVGIRIVMNIVINVFILL